MAWQAIAEADIQTQLTQPEMNAARTVVLAPGQADPLPEAITNGINMVRGYIAGSVNITLGAEGTIPDKLVLSAIDIVVYLLCKRLPGKILLNDRRRDAYDDAIKLLKDVAANRFRIEAPTEVTTEQIAIPTPAISTRTREHYRRREDGI